MRVNESFGEVVQWDLVPDFAINNMQIFTGGDPIFGQNAIGGAITMEMKNGFNFEGANLTTSGGSYGRTNEILNTENNSIMLEFILVLTSITITVGEIILNHTSTQFMVM